MKKLLIIFFAITIYSICSANAQTYVPGKTNPPPALKGPDTTAITIMIEAKFPGGPKGWQQYLQKNLKAEVAAENIVLKRRQKDSTETIIVSFLVDTTGNISEVKVENLNPVTPAVAAEAKRVIAKGPQWTPATIDGRRVIYRQKQSISFVVSSR